MMITPRSVVQNMQPYPAPSEGRYDAVRLDFNENTAGFPAAYPSGLPATLVSAYPEYGQFIAKAARAFAVGEDFVLPTNGSDEALQLIALTFVEKADKAVVSTPCFAVMPQCLKLAQAALVEVPVLDNMSFDIDAIEQSLQGAKIAMFASPENPTGAVIPAARIEKWCKQFPCTLFVIDEAYGEYAGTTILPLVNRISNLLVMKTFSKAWGMAGLRLGLLFGKPALIDYIKRIKLPYSVNSAATFTAFQLLDRADQVYAAARDTMVRKGAVEETLRARGYKIVSGSANSFLIQLEPSACKQLQNVCAAQKVLIRQRGENYLRVSVGSDQEMSLFLNALTQFENSAVLTK